MYESIKSADIKHTKRRPSAAPPSAKQCPHICRHNLDYQRSPRRRRRRGHRALDWITCHNSNSIASHHDDTANIVTSNATTHPAANMISPSQHQDQHHHLHRRRCSATRSPMSQTGTLRSLQMWAATITLITVLRILEVSASGNFELQLLEISNTNSHLLTGYCCGVASDQRQTRTTNCPPCQTAFRLCLKEYQNTTPTRPGVLSGCSFGNASSALLGGSSFVLSEPERGSIVLPFSFRWTKSFTLILQALDMYNTSYPVAEKLIEETSFSGVILPSPEWNTLDHIGKNARITYRVRVQCSANYYNTTCTTFCRPRNDQFGHYTCGDKGNKVCIAGWQGTNCDIAICKPGCDPVHGKCDHPGGCDCRPGWKGPLCNDCTVYPGCRHGYCNGSAWQCICDTNWGGILCDQDLNYCGTHEPCMHGGTCENTAPDAYQCTCAEGLSGTRCEIVEHPCATKPCRNGGTCALKEKPKFEPLTIGKNGTATGSSSSSPLDSLLLEHTTSTVRVVRGMQGMSSMGKPKRPANDLRSMLMGHAAAMAQAEMDGSGGLAGLAAAASSVAVTAASAAADSSTVSSGGSVAGSAVAEANEFTCACATGWTGPTCEINIDECAGGPCEHGGTCIDLVGGFRCECPAEWTGDVCQTDFNECEDTGNDSNGGGGGGVGRNSRHLGPCINAHACNNTPGGFQCQCQEGWGGLTCAKNLDDCALGQCQHGGTCFDLVNNYHCACALGYSGRDCETDIDECASLPCRHGGECVNLIGKFKCICPVGYSGTLCEEAKDHCSPMPCLEGSCLNTPGGYYCHCPPTRSGRHCEQVRAPCDRPPCNDGCSPGHNESVASSSAPGTTTTRRTTVRSKNDGSMASVLMTTTTTTTTTGGGAEAQLCSGHGQCESTTNGQHCACEPGYTGRFCELNLNECTPNPCRNGAICSDGVGEFHCECQPGWSGKTCSDPITQCLPGQCLNGGTCVPSLTPTTGTTGSSSSSSAAAAAAAAASSASTSGRSAAAIAAAGHRGASAAQCRCTAGWAGPFCSEPVDQCHGQPCHNGGTCESGAGWFRCVCARGFSGPDCRINVNECSPQPCLGGGTCQDGIGQFQCLCPPGRRGSRCEIVLTRPESVCANESSQAAALSYSQHEGSTASNATDDGLCNSCICVNGLARCSNLWCGLRNCLRSNATSACEGAHEVCVPMLQESCLVPPCPARGDCRALEPSHRVAPPRLPTGTDCWPNQARLSTGCARITILLEHQRLAVGTSVEGVCLNLRVLLGTRLVKSGGGGAGQRSGDAVVTANSSNGASGAAAKLVVLCDMKTGSNDSIEVTVSSPNGTPQSVSDAVRILSDLLSRQGFSLGSGAADETEAAPLAAILEVKVETAAISPALPQSSSSSGYLLAVATGTAVAVLCLAAIGAFFWRNSGGSLAGGSTSCRLMRRVGRNGPTNGGVENGMHSARQSRADLTSRHDEEKSNNLQNEENIRRYANPLKGSAQSLRAGGAIELTPAPEVALVSPMMAAATAAAAAASATAALHHRSTQQLFAPVAVGAPIGSQVGGGSVVGVGSLVGNSVGGGGGGVGSIGHGVELEFADKDPDSAHKGTSHRGSQILLFKAQNPDMHKNTIGSMESPLKDFGKRSINCQTLPGSGATATTQMVTMDPDVLSVHV